MISGFDCGHINVRIRITGSARLLGLVAFAAPGLMLAHGGISGLGIVHAAKMIGNR
jgi:hypothetical protein